MKIEVLGRVDSCAPCKQLKEELITKGVEFSFYEVDSTGRAEELLSQVRAAGGRMIPALFIDEEYIITASAKEHLQSIGVL